MKRCLFSFNPEPSFAAMKTLVCLCLLTLFARPSGWAQGTLYLANRDARMGVDAPIYYPGGVDRFWNGLRLEVLAGPDPSSLVTVFSHLEMGERGYWQPQTFTLDTLRPGGTAYIQVRAFLDGFGMSYDRAKERGLYHGAFEILPVVLGGDTGGGAHPPTLPGSLVGLKPLVLTGIPEPSACRLLLLAVAVVWLSGRRASQGSA